MPTFSIMESAPGPEVTIDGAPYLYFGGTSYLGLAAHPEVIEAGCSALRRYGVHSATSRARYGTNPPVLETELRAAEFFGVDAAFYFGSGYSANHILISALAAGADAVLVDDSAHYCVLEAARVAGLPVVTFRDRDPDDLGRIAKNYKSVVALSDAVCPSTGRVAPVKEYIAVLARCGRAALLLDDAHGFGVLGEHGRGLLEQLGLWPSVNGRSSVDGVSINVCGTLSKALGGFGGIVPGTLEYVAHARSASHYFDGASAPASSVAGSTAKALEIVMREPGIRRQLKDNIGRLRAGLRGLGLVVPEGETAHFGVAVGDAGNMRRIHESLKARGILLPFVTGYTGIPPSGLLRFAVFANHSADQIDRLVFELRVLL
jgi:7-keto-8-aminopelargonate synthetase-like enzyme